MKQIQVTMTEEQAQTIYTALRLETVRNRMVVNSSPDEESRSHNWKVLCQIEEALQVIAKAIS